MSNEEIKDVEQEKKECNCEFCRVAKKVLTIAIGTFIGFYCAMSLFYLMHRPTVMCPCHKFKKPYGIERFEHRGKFQGEHMKMKGEKPFKPMQMPAKPEVED